MARRQQAAVEVWSVDPFIAPGFWFSFLGGGVYHREELINVVS